MTDLKLDDVVFYVEQNIKQFHDGRLNSIKNLTLKKILLRKNPYLFRAKNIISANELVKSLVDAHLSSQEETMFGTWLEGLAIYINQKVFNGWKSGIIGIDLEFNNENKRYIVAIKSGPNWGNSSQIKKMITDFDKARKTLRTSDSKIDVVAVNGCCYGRDSNPYKSENYYKYCGQEFWKFISGEENLYIDIIKPLGYKAQQRDEEFNVSYHELIHLFTMELNELFCTNGIINWEKLLKYNSSLNKD